MNSSASNYKIQKQYQQKQQKSQKKPKRQGIVIHHSKVLAKREAFRRTRRAALHQLY